MRAIVGRWGRSLAVRLPVEIAEEAGLTEGQKVDLVAMGGEVVMRPARERIDIQAMFRGLSPEAWRAVYAGSYDWGEERGREAVEE